MSAHNIKANTFLLAAGLTSLSFSRSLSFSFSFFPAGGEASAVTFRTIFVTFCLS